MISMYKIYFKKHTDLGSEVFEKKTTKGFHTASKIFWEYRQRSEFEGQHIDLVVSLNNQHQVYHRFDKLPGDIDFVGLNDDLPGELLARQEIDTNFNSHRQGKKRVEANLVGDEIALYERVMARHKKGPKFGLRQLLVALCEQDEANQAER